MPTLYIHKNNKDVAVEVLSFLIPSGKKYAKIKIRWWNVGPHKPYCMGFIAHLTDASLSGKNKYKYSLEKWDSEWRVYETHS
jgi:hypothetical protein